ncbi:MAG: Ig-like domain-containing protein [Prevotellaceae bacterium]|jgi:uncharacterized protein (TIGR02145 family)|nr:Ig-like domain-containing protein [Prevotellaceae bacterium]
MKKVLLLSLLPLMIFSCKKDKEVTGIELNKTTLTMQVGEQQLLVAKVSPKNADQSVVWTSSNINIVSVDNGKLTALAAGSVAITAQAGSKTATCEVVVQGGTPIEVESIALNKTSLTLNIDAEETLVATVVPSSAAVTWTSSDSNKATVSSDGKVTAVAEGSATITAQAGGKTATCEVVVQRTPIEVESIALNKTSLTLDVGEEETLIPTVLPDNAANPNVTWTSSDNNKATVSSDGKVTAVAEGSATITAQAGNQTADCPVTVTDLIHTDEGVMIGSTRWATRNVDAPNTFTRNPEDAGMFYQWNSKTGWSSTDPMIASNGSITWNTTPSSSTFWQMPNNPCPEGWRIPTRTELTALSNAGSTLTSINGIDGRRFGSGSNTIFLPMQGSRNYTNGALSSSVGYVGDYWSSTYYNNTEAYFLLLTSTIDVIYSRKTYGFSCRCVKDNQ